MDDWEILETYIREHGQECGSVSWQMAQDALGRLRQGHGERGALRVAMTEAVDDIEMGFPNSAKVRLESILAALANRNPW